MGSALDSAIWKGNSKQMYKLIMSAVPGLFKSMVKNEVEKWLVANNVNVITEELVIQMFKEKAPKGIYQKVAPKLENMKTHGDT